MLTHDGDTSKLQQNLMSLKFYDRHKTMKPKTGGVMVVATQAKFNLEICPINYLCL